MILNVTVPKGLRLQQKKKKKKNCRTPVLHEKKAGLLDSMALGMRGVRKLVEGKGWRA